MPYAVGNSLPNGNNGCLIRMAIGLVMQYRILALGGDKSEIKSKS